jgi:hypothetical protein
MKGSEHHEAIPTVVASTDECEDLSPREEPVEDLGGGAPSTLHEGGLGDPLALDGVPVKSGGLFGRGCPDSRTCKGPERRRTHAGVPSGIQHRRR